MPILGWAAGLMVAALVLLAIPVEMRFHVRGVLPPHGEVVVRALFGLWWLRMAVPPQRHAAEPAPNRAGEAGLPRPARRQSGQPARLRALWRDAKLRRAGRQATRQVLRAARWSDLRVRVHVGLDDPADTGRLWAALGPFGAMLAGVRTAELSIRPDFAESRLDLEARGRLFLVPLRLIGPLGVLAGRAALTMTVRRLAGQPGCRMR